MRGFFILLCFKFGNLSYQNTCNYSTEQNLFMIIDIYIFFPFFFAPSASHQQQLNWRVAMLRSQRPSMVSVLGTPLVCLRNSWPKVRQRRSVLFLIQFLEILTVRVILWWEFCVPLSFYTAMLAAWCRRRSSFVFVCFQVPRLFLESQDLYRAHQVSFCTQGC